MKEDHKQKLVDRAKRYELPVLNGYFWIDSVGHQRMQSPRQGPRGSVRVL